MEDGELVVDAAHALDPDLACPRGHGVVRLRGQDEVVDADLVETAQPRRVAAEARDALLAAVVRPHAVVGEDAVEVEDDEADRRRASVTPRARRRASCGGLDVLGDDRLLGRERTRTSVRPSRASSSYGGRPPSAGDFATRSPWREHVPGREARARRRASCPSSRADAPRSAAAASRRRRARPARDGGRGRSGASRPASASTRDRCPSRRG